MLLRHVINTYVGSKIFKSSLPKVQNSDEMAPIRTRLWFIS